MQNKSRTRTHLLLSLSEVCYVKLLDHQVKRTLHLELERNPPWASNQWTQVKLRLANQKAGWPHIHISHHWHFTSCCECSTEVHSVIFLHCSIRKSNVFVNVQILLQWLQIAKCCHADKCHLESHIRRAGRTGWSLVSHGHVSSPLQVTLRDSTAQDLGQELPKAHRVTCQVTSCQKGLFYCVFPKLRHMHKQRSTQGVQFLQREIVMVWTKRLEAAVQRSV